MALLGGVVVVLVIAGVAWIGVHAVWAGRRLNDVRGDVARVRADLVAGRSPTTDLAQTQRDASAADNDTHDPAWSAVSWLPPVHTVRGLSAAADDLAQNALPPVVAVGSTLQPSELRVTPNTLALAPLGQAVAPLHKADVALSAATQEVEALPSGWFGPISSARTKVLTQLTSLSGSVDDAARFARVGPAMLGAHGPRHYFVGIENNAESRGTGGLVAAYAIVTTDHGRVTVTKRGNDSQLQAFQAAHSTVNLGTDYTNFYGGYLPTQRWTTTNLSPNFPSAADIWAHLWQAQTGEHIDGAFGVDPLALQAMVGAAGPVTVPGYSGTYGGKNLASFIESGEYSQFAPGPNRTAKQALELRKNFVSKVASAVLNRLLSGSGSASAIATAMGQSAGEGHLALWSARPAEEAQISGTPLAGELLQTAAPFASVTVDNATGSKLDYYLNRTLIYRADGCSGQTRDSTVTVQLDNAAPLHGLPSYVRLRGDLGGKLSVEKVPQNRVFVLIHTTRGAALRRATLNGNPVAVSSGTELGHPVYRVELTLNPGVTQTIQLRLQEPVVAGAATTKVQPLARPQHTIFTVPTCSS